MKSSSLNQLTAVIAVVALASLAFVPSSVAFGAFIAAVTGLIALIVINDYAPRRSLLDAKPAGQAGSQSTASFSGRRLNA